MESQIEGESLPFKYSNVAPHITSSLAIVNSWTAAFVDQSPVDGLRGHIVQLLESEILKKTTTQTYGRYCSLVQSSGMGKSRLVDEFSKMFFLIPMNLRATTDQGTYCHFSVL